ncbi:Apt Adenine/guanine phosphoribosyltransferases and related PRPP-binding proteins [actinobacterium SCGC AAA044-D11]
MSRAELEGAIRQVPDFPAPGILFFDILPLLKDPKHFSNLTKELSAFAKFIDVVAGIEARGLILGSAVALELGKGFVPLRKKGKLPGATFEESYGLEYGNDTLEIQEGVLSRGDRVLLIDDVLATGGTLVAGVKLIHQCGAVVESVVVALEIAELPGRDKFAGAFPDISLNSLFIK